MIVDAATAPTSGQNRLHTVHLSVAGGQTQFGACVDTLEPGAWSSRRHWHKAEDELLFILEGTATLRDDEGEHRLDPGDAVCWRHGYPNAHHVINRGDAPCRWLITGSRAEGDICHYPDCREQQVNRDTIWAVMSAKGQVLCSGDLPPELLGLPPVWGTAFDAKIPAARIRRAAGAQPAPCGRTKLTPRIRSSAPAPVPAARGRSAIPAAFRSLAPLSRSCPPALPRAAATGMRRKTR